MRTTSVARHLALRLSRLRLLVIGVWGVATCLLVNAWAETALRERPLGSGPVRLELAHNTGVAFSVAAGWPTPLTAGLTGAVIVGVVVITYRSADPVMTATPVGWALVAAGGLANLLDRLEDGAVTDYAVIYSWPTFNTADVLVVTGACLVVLGITRAGRRPDP